MYPTGLFPTGLYPGMLFPRTVTSFDFEGLDYPLTSVISKNIYTATFIKNVYSAVIDP